MARQMPRAILAILLALSSCRMPPRDFRISPDFEPSEVDAIVAQARKWDAAHVERITFESDAEGAIELVEICPRGECSGQMHLESGVLSIVDYRERPDWTRLLGSTALHEFGHCLADRSDHLPPGSVMSDDHAMHPERLTAPDFGYVFSDEAP